MRKPAAAIGLALISWAVAGPAALPAQSPGNDGALAGAVDIHVHHLPDDRPRSIDAIDV